MRVSGGVARFALAVGSTAALAACGGDGGTGPGRASLDPAVIGPRADRIAALVQQPAIAAVLAQGSAFGLPSLQRSVAGLQRTLAPALLRAASGGAESNGSRLVRATRLSATPAVRRAATTASSSLIPDSLLGRTLVLSAQGHYVVDPTRTGAPAAGVRFVIVTPGTTQEIAYADLTDQVSATGESTVIDVVAGGRVVLHDATDVVTSSTGENDTSTGYLTNGTDRMDFNFAIVTTYGSVEDRTTAVLTFASTGIGVAMMDSSVVSGLTASDKQVGRMMVGANTIRSVTNSVADASSGYVPSDTSHVTVNGAPYATIVSGSAGVSYFAPDGSTLSDSDRSALASFQQIALTSFEVILAEVVVLYWLFDAAGY